MSPHWWQVAQLQAISEHDPDEYGGLGWDELSDDQQERAIEMVLDDSAHEFYLDEPSGMLGR